MFTVMIRTAILYSVVLLTMRLMGKRQIGELEPFELAIAIMVSELGSLPMQDLGMPLIHGTIPIFTLLILQTIITILELKSETFRKILCGKPSVLINCGKLDIKELRNQRLSFNDLMEELRLKGYYNLEDIEYAVLETSGELSILPKTDVSSVTKKDLNIQCTQDILPITLILDGEICTENLKIINKDIHWLQKQLRKNKIEDSKQVFIALLNSKNKFYFQLRD